MGTGLSNDETAAALVISPLTVKTHITRASTKLGVRDRVQSVILAYEHGLVSPSPTDTWTGGHRWRGDDAFSAPRMTPRSAAMHRASRRMMCTLVHMMPEADGRSTRDPMLAGDPRLPGDPEPATHTMRAADPMEAFNATSARDPRANAVATGDPARVVRTVGPDPA
ncbi:response regulator transcription factor [Streptosporangium sandarakinum]|uniref:response regulator transcription factor n=1 Tax=Streptosporangium sandarakinum TaxID=1260955 RepID=UPI00341428FB